MSLTIARQWKQRFLDLHAGHRIKPLELPKGIGQPLALITTDSHAEVERILSGLEKLPVFPRHIDLGDKLDRGPEPLAANQMLEFTNPPAHRLIGNHDAMWIGAGLGIPRLAIELVRWLMRYNEQEFLVQQMGVSLTPLESFANRHFGDFRGHFKSSLSKPMEAAATYLKIIAEAPYRFPEHKNAELKNADLRLRAALFHNDAIEALEPAEKETFDRLTGDAKLSAKDTLTFYRLMGGLRKFDAEEQLVVDHFTEAFRSSHAYYQLIEYMVGRGDAYTTMTMSLGAPVDLLFTHAGIPITREGRLAEFHGKKGAEAFGALENDIRMAMTAWRHYVETGDREFLDMDAGIIDRLGELPWGSESPLYMRVMQTAARAVLEKGSGLYAEPEGAFFSHWAGERSTDSEFVHRVCREISTSFGLSSRRLVVVHGHKPEKTQGSFVVSAGGDDLYIDAGASDNYGGHGAFLLVGTGGMYRFALDKHEFHRIELGLEYFGSKSEARILI